MSENRFFDPADKSRFALLYSNLKEEVFGLLEKNVKITASWNAGGDETPGEIEFYPESAADRDMGDALFWTIISALNLPGAGETYDEGSGEIYKGADNSLRLKFASRERTYGTEKERADEIFVLPIGDLLPLREMKDKVNIYLSGSMNDLGTVYSWANITDKETRKPVISEEEGENYKQVVEEVLRSYTHAVELEKIEHPDYADAFVGGNVRVDFKEFRGDDVAFDVSFSYELVLDHSNEDVVLIDALGKLGEWEGRFLY